MFTFGGDSGETKGKNIAGVKFSQALGLEDWARTDLQGKGIQWNMGW